jgi:hypothetical protein
MEGKHYFHLQGRRESEATNHQEAEFLVLGIQARISGLCKSSIPKIRQRLGNMFLSSGGKECGVSSFLRNVWYLST